MSRYSGTRSKSALVCPDSELTDKECDQGDAPRAHEESILLSPGAHGGPVSTPDSPAALSGASLRGVSWPRDRLKRMASASSERVRCLKLDPRWYLVSFV
eukprot:CAMPEP_0179445536 /NCGR_PEP_ID=MMETSP0799-20121207/28953_1 /TAXON_ID=46947 /ORGANISM="Geminigera cryophila, Strain CCMP2564" /LENGTH=99 /DNA_ID=CAMNT_0021233619 /DNA_START=586 /DNA_END=885 /DNA_ORIENTATION=-